MDAGAGQACCAFLTFSVQELPGSVEVTITAPERAREIGVELLALFAGQRGQLLPGPAAAHLSSRHRSVSADAWEREGGSRPRNVSGPRYDRKLWRQGEAASAASEALTRSSRSRKIRTGAMAGPCCSPQPFGGPLAGCQNFLAKLGASPDWGRSAVSAGERHFGRRPIRAGYSGRKSR